jgi:hypothetical protein
MTTYTDTREAIERSHQRPLQVVPTDGKSTRFIRIFLVILIGLTLLSAGMAALKILFP